MSVKALVIVDVQNDFLPGGALAVPNSDEIIHEINRIQNHFDIVVATQDWHPANHGSFASNHKDKKVGEVIKLNSLDQILWPDHCVQGTHGAEFAKGFDMSRVSTIFRKGMSPEVDSYSAFCDNGRLNHTGLYYYLDGLKVDDVSFCGLATEYCVKFSVLDAINYLPIKVTLLTKACRGVNLNPDDVENAVNEMKNNGVIIN